MAIAGLLSAASTAGADQPSAASRFPHRYTLTSASVGHWAAVLRSVTAHRRPETSSPAVTRLGVVTGEWTQNVVLVIAGVDLDPAQTWYEVRLPILPNNSTGWVPRSALGSFEPVHTHLYVHRATFTATLERDGRTTFTSRVGIGRPSSPTPAGEFYVRNELSGFHEPFYGPIAFGTNGRSAVLTEWPGGGFIGIHGTNDPASLPGAVSHG